MRAVWPSHLSLLWATTWSRLGSLQRVEWHCCRIMREYMPKVGTLGHDMMFRSTTIQVIAWLLCIRHSVATTSLYPCNWQNLTFIEHRNVPVHKPFRYSPECYAYSTTILWRMHPIAYNGVPIWHSSTMLLTQLSTVVDWIYLKSCHTTHDLTSSARTDDQAWRQSHAEQPPKHFCLRLQTAICFFWQAFLWQDAIWLCVAVSSHGNMLCTLCRFTLTLWHHAVHTVQVNIDFVVSWCAYLVNSFWLCGMEFAATCCACCAGQHWLWKRARHGWESQDRASAPTGGHRSLCKLPFQGWQTHR